MKRILSIAMVLFAMTMMVKASDDKPINVEQLPKAAKEFIATHFVNEKIAVAKQDTDFMDKDYKVIFVSGNKVEFDKKGVWKEVDCERSSVPSSIIPSQIKTYLKSNYPDKVVTQIENKNKGKYKYEVELDNSMEIKFNKSFEVVEIDY